MAVAAFRPRHGVFIQGATHLLLVATLVEVGGTYYQVGVAEDVLGPPA